MTSHSHPYLPDRAQATGAAMVICPGGAYSHLAPHEGKDYALWLNQHGVTCFVLNTASAPAATAIRRCCRTPPARCVWFGPGRRIGTGPQARGHHGFLGRGHLASTLLTHFDSGKADSADPVERQSSRPDLGILCYPVISMGQYAHKGSKDSLLGANPPPELVQLLSSELQ